MQELRESYGNGEDDTETKTSRPHKRAKLGMGSSSKDGDHQETPRDLYAALNEEFKFDFDPCPLHGEKDFDGLSVSWKKTNFVVLLFITLIFTESTLV